MSETRTPTTPPDGTATTTAAPTPAVDPATSPTGPMPVVTLALPRLPDLENFGATPIDLTFVPHKGDDTGYDALEDDPDDDTATPAEECDRLIVVDADAEPFGVYLVNARGNLPGLTEVYGTGIGNPLIVPVMRQGALDGLRSAQQMLTRTSGGRLRFVVLTGLVDAFETASAFEMSFKQACTALGFPPETEAREKILAAGREARNVNTPALCADSDDELAVYMANLGRGGALNYDAPLTKGTGGALNLWLMDTDGKPAYVGYYYDDPTAGVVAEMDFYERPDAFETFHQLVENTESLQRCMHEHGFDPQDMSQVSDAFDTARVNRRLLFWSLLSVNALPYHGLVSFWDFARRIGIDIGGSYCRSAMLGLKVARWTCRGANKQYETLGLAR